MTSYTPILALARAGATSRAWDAFVAAGLDGAEEVGALTLKGRLLKDRARQAAGAERVALFAQSGAAYRAAARLRPDSYPLINAAAMALFAGDGAAAATLAQDVLTLIDGDRTQGETPYWREATRAEALLLTGRIEDAKTSLAEAIALAPQAWEDHASTLRQFAAILRLSGAAADWLDRFRPAPLLHYSGILGISADDQTAAQAISEAIARIGPACGFGALAAGADIIMAEALLAEGADLHIVLPVEPALFRQGSVHPFGADWGARFDRLVEAAATLTICTAQDNLTRANVALAEYRAMGMAAERADLLETSAIALRVEPGERPSVGDPWLASNRRLEHVPVGKSASLPADILLPEGTLLFLLALAGDAPHAEPMGFTTLAELLAALPPQHSAAIDCRTDGTRATVAAMLHNAAEGTVIASMAATMALLAEGRTTRVEPLGEMPSDDGATPLYAIRLKESP